MDTTDYGAKERGLGHNPQNSAASMSDVLSQPAQQPRDSLGYSYGQYGVGTPYSESSSYQAAKRDPPSRSTTLVHPAVAYTEEPNPTPTYYNPHDNYDYDGIGPNRPAQSQSHPGKTSYLLATTPCPRSCFLIVFVIAEGSFGRKAPRLVKPYTSSGY
jgi:hypothetical protein